MTLDLLLAFLGWCTLINIVILLVWWILFALARDWVRHLHGKWFHLPKETFEPIHYGGMMLFKIGIILLNLVPYLALRIVG